jgi:Zn-dependent M28 family amino/carboxypeptidase
VDELTARRPVRVAVAMLLMAAAPACRSSLPAPSLPPGIAADVAYLASPQLHGRGAGTAEGDSAAAYLARHYERLGLAPAFPAVCPATTECGRSYFQFFSIDGPTAQNVAVVVPGSDSSLSGEYVVVGAHYDHLGMSTLGALDPERGGAIRPGADDNASGTAAVMELGRRLAAHPARRSVLLVNFDAEEIGLVGSRVFVDHLPVPRTAIVLMVNLDMVGRLRTGGLTVDLSSAPERVGAMMDSVAQALGLVARHSSVTAQRSDHASFGRAGIPAVSLFTGFHSDYHRTSDVAVRLDVAGIARITDLVEAILRAVIVAGSSGQR